MVVPSLFRNQVNGLGLLVMQSRTQEGFDAIIALSPSQARLFTLYLMPYCCRFFSFVLSVDICSLFNKIGDNAFITNTSGNVQRCVAVPVTHFQQGRCDGGLDLLQVPLRNGRHQSLVLSL